MKLTKDEIILLERIVDNAREGTMMAHIRFMEIISKFKLKDKISDKRFDEMLKGWDTLNTISSKLMEMRR